MNDKILKLKELKGVLNSRYGITDIALFGSYASETETLQSDIDILIIKMKRKNGFTIARAKMFISQALQIEVDLGLFDAVRPYLKKKIEKEMIYV